MEHNPKNIFIAGGTGFLGYYSALQFLEKGCNVSSISLENEIDLEGWYPKSVELAFGDLFSMETEEISALFRGKNFDTLVYALGPDDRVTPKKPSYPFFKSRLVDQCLRICNAAKDAGVKRCIVLNSYFAYFDRLKHGALAKLHPYIRCRVEQAEAIISLGEEGVFEVMILELPYIFGSMPERVPIWKSVFIDRFKKLPLFVFPGGGTAAVHVKSVAKAIYASTVNGKHGEKYTVGDENIKYAHMFRYMLRAAGINKRLLTLPRWISFVSGWVYYYVENAKGLQGGLDLRYLMSGILSDDLFFDPDETPRRLRYEELGFIGGDSCWQGIKEAMASCYPETFVDI
jgi:dihydroflavonol-4-reductase